jgi:transcriptional regulator with XRE-family HTH domain
MKKNTAKPRIAPIIVRSSEQTASAIRRIRKLCGLSQMALAKKAGLTQAAISRVESASNERIEIRTLFLILAALDADLIIAQRPQRERKISLEGII